MQVLFPAALDGISSELVDCPSRAWLPAAQEAWDAAQEGSKRRGKRGEVPFPPAAAERALLTATVEGLPLGEQSDVKAPLTGFPVWAWATPDGVELSFSTLSSAVRRRLAATDDPAALAHAEGGWRTPLAVFRFADGLQQLRVTSRTKMPWSDYVVLRETLLDALADRRQPLLARLAEIAGVAAMVASERALPTEFPVLNARLFLAWRGFLESRVAAASATELAAFAQTAWPLFRDDLTTADGLEAALAGDWRADLRTWIVPDERSLTEAIEGYLGVRLFAAPLDRFRTVIRGHVELLEGFATGLRYAAAFGALQGAPLTGEQIVAALALGEHAVAQAGAALPGFALPKSSHDRGPRMADLDMTLESIC